MAPQSDVGAIVVRVRLDVRGGLVIDDVGGGLGAAERGCVVIRQWVAYVPADDVVDLRSARRMPAEQRQPEDERRHLVDAIAGYFADRADSYVFGPPRVWYSRELASPVTDAGVSAGIAAPVAETVGGISAGLILAPVDRVVGDFSRTIDVVVMAVGVLTGQLHWAALAAKRFLRREFHAAVENGLAELIDVPAPATVTASDQGSLPKISITRNPERANIALRLAPAGTGNPNAVKLAASLSLPVSNDLDIERRQAQI